ncbi:MAG TPA: tetratricopeptide repeat protein, partial [Pyrinomonadaceae bacterium]|nr:tetratricopeptide repeat protein [Pyrinomonadaceae bacterium]
SNFDVARTAVSMAPNDPLTHWRVAQVAQQNLPLDQQAQAIAEYEKAVNLSPNDYRYWMSLGTAYERAGEVSKAEQALKRAVTLAPSYAYPHWFLGNLLLRNARYDEAFPELRLASEADPELRSQQFSFIWEIYSNDAEGLKNAVGQSSGARAAFAQYLLLQKRYEDGLRLWDGLSNEEKKANKDTAQTMITTLKSDLKFHYALNVWNDIANEKYRAEVGHVFDGSFEEFGPETVFGWQVKGAPQMQIGLDPNKGHSGERSLKLVFQVRSNLESINIAQLVPVQTQTEYDFECFISTDKLETGSAPQIVVLDASTGTALATSPMAPGGTNDWNPISLSFKTGEKTEGVIITIVRASCSNDETPVCPIFGSIWYDDFSIKRRN